MLKWFSPDQSQCACTPFVELLAYTVRDKGFDMLYVPVADVREARKIKEIAKIGHSVVDDKGDAQNPDVIVVLGGLAMPKFGCAPEAVNQMIESLSSGGKRPQIIGVCFMDIFERAGWDTKIPFDTVIDTTMECVVK